MLGTEPAIVANFVDSGQVRILFWPVINHGQPSLDATVAAYCAGEQEPELFWAMHETLFENFNELYRAERDFFIGAALNAGAAQAPFKSCFDGGAMTERVLAVDRVRRDRGIFGQPVFDINDSIFYGAASYDIFAQALTAALP